MTVIDPLADLVLHVRGLLAAIADDDNSHGGLHTARTIRSADETRIALSMAERALAAARRS